MAYHNRIMSTPLLQNLALTRVLTALAWGMLAASVVFWAIRTSDPASTSGNPVAATPTAAPNPQATAFLLGQRSTAAAPVQEQARTQSRYQLMGVLAGTRSQQGAALIAVNGKPARAYPVGATIEGDDGWILQSLQGRTARLGTERYGDAGLELEMPEFKPKS